MQSKTVQQYGIRLVILEHQLCYTLLIYFASSSRLPDAAVFRTISEPAKSTRNSFPKDFGREYCFRGVFCWLVYITDLFASHQSLDIAEQRIIQKYNDFYWSQHSSSANLWICS